MSSVDYNDGSGIEPQPELENVAVIEYSDFVKCLTRIVTLHFEENVTPPAFLEALRKTSNQVITKKKTLMTSFCKICICR